MEAEEKEEVGGGSSLITLPWEDVVFAYIFRALDCRDLFSLRRTCRTMRTMVEEYFVVAPVVDFSFVGQKIPRDVGVASPRFIPVLFSTNQQLLHLSDFFKQIITFLIV
jgi:hypothetical protein